MHNAELSLAKTEIIKQIEYFPAFLTPAIASDSIYISLARQTLSSYINNPLPVRLKEKLFVVLSHYYAVDYFTICHSCMLHSIGVSTDEILNLQAIHFPQREKSAIAQLNLLDSLWQKNWQNDLQIEAALIRCSGFIFIDSLKTSDFCHRLKKLLGTVDYHYLIILLGYIKLCHQWVIANPTISHQKDRRSQMYLGSLLLKETKLARFFQSRHKQNSIAGEVGRQTPLAQIKVRLRSVLETETGYWNWDLATHRVEICHCGRMLLGLKDFDNSYTAFWGSIHPSEKEFVDLEVARAIQTDRDLDLVYRIVQLDGEIVQVRNLAKLNYNDRGQPVSISGVIAKMRSILAHEKFKHLSSTISVSKPPGGNKLAAFYPEKRWGKFCKLKMFPFDRGLSQKLLSWDSTMSENTLQTIEEFKSILNLLPYYMFVVDVKSQTVSLMNSGLASCLSLSNAQQAEGKTIAECFPSEYVSQIVEQHQYVIQNRQVLHARQKMTLADGLHYFDAVITPVYNNRGDLYVLLHSFSDLADLADTQEALSQRTIQLEAANRELESFSYSVSHDLQAPLRIINGFSQVLGENFQTSLGERGQHYLQRIQANSQRMSDLIDALLQLSRVTRSQMKLVRVNLSTIALDIVKELQITHPERQVEAIVTPDLHVKGDPQLLSIVLNNLLNNSWKYTSKRAQSKIEFGMVNDNSSKTYFVRDNGAGFDPEYADKLFTAFQRLHSQSEFPGTGIGLATVKRIIYRHGGQVWAEGECDRGATIYFSL
jgi:signal transduction histidine kinase